jgi:hypothetical protein
MMGRKVLSRHTVPRGIGSSLPGKLQNAADGDGSLLDHTEIVYGSGISNGFERTHTNLPILVAGGGAGIVRGGCHRRYADTPLANLHLTILDNLGLRRDSLGDSNGELPLLS